jgi:3-hydroxyisobutyrate dehydrogenase-like beta-hydroxyacid dehydrogenase
MNKNIALIGFGEAGRTFALGGGWGESAHVFDIKTAEPGTADEKRAQYRDVGVVGYESAASALKARSAALSLVTADQALNAATSCAPMLDRNALWLDLNSVAPATKRQAALAISAAGGRYLDVAVMAPVEPGRMSVPLLISGPDASAGHDLLSEIGFKNLRIVGSEIGQASAIKMIRSIMVKGIEALSAEMILAASHAGVVDDVLQSLGAEWPKKIDYNLDRMMVHGLRRAAEMEEVVKTLVYLGVTPALTRGTVERQRQIGQMNLGSPDGLKAKLNILSHRGAS